MGDTGSVGAPQPSTPAKRFRLRPLAWAGLLPILSGCALMPGELNLSPIYRHRLDDDGSVREMDVIWPIFHYRKTEDDGWEFRVRPLYRHVSEGEQNPWTEHQFLWPFGRYRFNAEETLGRVFPFWRYQSRPNKSGLRETDWDFMLLFWGGTREDGNENYFAFMPFYADIPDFLSYDRFQMHLWPLHMRLTKKGLVSHIFLWPLIGFGSDEEGRRYWHRVLPFYSVDVDEKKFYRYGALWPFFYWGTEHLHLDPYDRFFFFPFYGRQWSAKLAAWTVLWPFFQKMEIEGERYKLDLLWPIFRYQTIDRATSWMRQFWVWPFYGRTRTHDKDAWSVLWPIIWVREHDDAYGVQSQTWVLPFYWSVETERKDELEEDLTRVWPLFHTQRFPNGHWDYKTLSPWPWRKSYADGVDALYSWVWTIAEGRGTKTSSNFDLVAHIYSSSERDGRTQTSVPFLFNYESDEDGGTLRLFQFLPIPWGGGDSN